MMSLVLPWVWRLFIGFAPNRYSRFHRHCLDRIGRFVFGWATPPPLTSSAVQSRSASPSRESAPPPLPGISMTSMSSSTSSARSAGRRKAARPKKIVTDEETAKLCALRQRRATARQERAAARGAAKTECGMGAKASASGAGLCVDGTK